MSFLTLKEFLFCHYKIRLPPGLGKFNDVHIDMHTFRDKKKEEVQL